MIKNIYIYVCEFKDFIIYVDILFINCFGNYWEKNEEKKNGN